MPSKFASNSINMQWKNMKVEGAYGDQAYFKCRFLNGTNTFRKLKTRQTKGKPAMATPSENMERVQDWINLIDS
jgi:hypothetical protein